MSDPALLDIFADVVCPWCWVGKAHLARALKTEPALEVRVRHRPFLLDPSLPAEGEPYLRDALAIRQKNFPADDFVVAHTSSMLGECLTAQKRFEEAEPLLRNSYNNLKAKVGDQNRRTLDARKRLAKLYDDWNKPDQAAQFR